MAFLTESALYNSYQRSRVTMDSAPVYKSFSNSSRTTIFLSHSHLDKEYVQGFIKILSDNGLSVYVDWNDSSMPKVTNRDTAEGIKKKIKENQLFMILATTNALNSRWVPWEVGIADQAKTSSQIFIIPVRKDDGTFVGNEYLQLYNRLEYADDGKLAVFQPSMDRGQYFSDVIVKGGY